MFVCKSEMKSYIFCSFFFFIFFLEGEKSLNEKWVFFDDDVGDDDDEKRHLESVLNSFEKKRFNENNLVTKI